MSRPRLVQFFPLLPVIAALAVYANALPASFQWDDFNVIVDYSPVHSLAGWAGELAGGVRPLLKLSYTLNWLVSSDPSGFHLINNLLHAANSLMVFSLTRRMADKKGNGPLSPWLALTCALLFALHPVRTEAVTYVSGRSVSLMAFFSLASLLAFAEGLERDSRWLRDFLSPALFALALLARETAISFPLALFIWAAFVHHTGIKSSLRSVKSHFIVLVVAVFAAFALGRPVVLYLQALNEYEGSGFLLRQSHGIAYLVSRLFAITGMNIDPDLPQNSSLTLATALEAAILPAMAIGGVWLARKKHLAGFGLIWFVINILPTNSLIPRFDVASERHMYLAAVGLEWAALFALAGLAARLPKPSAALMLALLLALGTATMARNADYRTEISLWEDTVRKSPAKSRPHVNLGYAYLMAGRDEDAEVQFLKGLELDPSNETAARNLDLVRGRQKR